MHRTRTLLAILAALLIAGPVRADERDKDLRAVLEGIHKILASIKGDIDLIKPAEMSLRLADIEARLHRLEDSADHQGSRSSFYPTEPDLKTVDDFRGYLRSLDDRIRALENRSASGTDNTRINRSFSPTPVPALPLTGTSTIRLENTWTVPATIVLDGVSYRLAPGETRSLTGRPVGPYTYDVLIDGLGLVRAGRTRTLTARYTDIIYIDPPGVVR